MRSTTIAIYEILIPSQSAALKVISIFIHQADVGEDRFDSEIAPVLSEAVVVDRIHFIGYDDSLVQVRDWFQSGSVIFERLNSVVGDVLKNTKLITFDRLSGRHTSSGLDNAADAEMDAVLLMERRAGLKHMFIKNGGQMEAPEGFHYESPSGRHVNKFIRVANTIECGRHVSVFAFWLLPSVWKKGIKNIFVDTSSISAVAIALAYELKNKSGEGGLPIVTSYQSYGGLSKLHVSNLDAGFFLISVSTSGGLRDRLISAGVKSDRIVSIYSLVEDGTLAGEVLCDLVAKEYSVVDDFKPLRSFDEISCPYCKSKSYPIKILGDQFSVAPPLMKEVHIKKEDIPGDQLRVLDELVGMGLFRVSRSLENREKEISFDVSTLFYSADNLHDKTAKVIEKVAKKWKGFVKRGMPIHLGRIIFAAYPFSKELAESAKDLLSAHGVISVGNVMESRAVRDCLRDPETASLVVASCIDDAHEFMGINRDLRAVQPHGNTTYVSPIFRSSSKSEFNRIKSNLTYGEQGPNTFSLHSIYNILLPECNKKHSWVKELDGLRGAVQWADVEGLDVPSTIDERIGFLEGVSQSGMSEGLYWVSPGGEALSLNPDFAFIDTEGGFRRLSQADVFVVVSVLLHNLRSGMQEGRLSYSLYERSMLSPDNFSRFNDGVLQASILRAARDRELSFSNSSELLSMRMTDFLLSEIDKSNAGGGGALMEFLIALLVGTLTLHSQHVLSVVDAVLKKGSELPECFCFLASYLKFLFEKGEVDR